MVKTRASFLFFSVLLLASCGVSRRLVAVRPETLSIPGGASGRYVSLALCGDSLVGVFADGESTTLRLLQVALGPRLPDSAPVPSIIDRVDVTPPLSPTFGEHALAARDGTLRVLYQDRMADDKLVLKLASRTLEAVQWTVDVMEPAGDPVAILTGQKRALSLFWAAGSLLARTPTTATQGSQVLAPFQLSARASVFGETGFTCYNGLAGALVAIRQNGAEIETSVVPGGNPVHASLASADGLLSILTWSAAERRLSLIEQKTGSQGISRTTVTLCDGTGTVALLPAGQGNGYIMLFDEARRMGGGRMMYDLSLIAPGAVMGAPGQRYHKAILLSAEQPVRGFSAVKARGALYVLVLQDGLKLLRLGLNSQ